MHPEISIGKLDAAYDALMRQLVAIETYGWKITRDGSDIFVGMSPRGRPEKSALLCIRCEGFDARPPSYLFVDPNTREPSAACMPKGSGFIHDPGRTGVCIHGTREYYELIHPADHREWSAEQNPFAVVLQKIQILLERAQW